MRKPELDRRSSLIALCLGVAFGILGFGIGSLLFGRQSASARSSDEGADVEVASPVAEDRDGPDERSDSDPTPNLGLELVEGGWAVPISLLREGSTQTLSGWEPVKDVIDLVEMSDQEVEAVSGVIEETYRTLGESFLAAAELEGEVTADGARFRIPAVSATGSEHIRRLDKGLVDALGRDRAALFRALSGDSMHRYLAGFGTLDQEIIVSDKQNGNLSFSRNAIDRETGEKLNRIESTGWEVDDEEVRGDYEDSKDMGMVREILIRMGWWSK